MKYRIIGNNLQMAEIEMPTGVGIYAEAGSMVNMSGTMTMGSELKGGIISGLKRAVTGESLFLTRFVSPDGPGFVAFAGTIPGKIFAVEITFGKQFIAQRESFLCCDEGIELDMAVTANIPAGLFGGGGFVFEKMSGNGTLLLHCCGDIAERTLLPGETVKVQTGLVVGFDDTVSYDISLAGGVTTALFGGEGLFVTTLTGPGKVVLQSMNLAKIATALIPYLPKPEIKVKPV